MISVLCPTYGRPELLAELVECFLRQTVSDTELVILNDRADQRLVCDHPKVRIINETERYPTLGHKRLAVTRLALGSLITHWDDDDIYLPDHLERVVARFPLYWSQRCARQHHQWLDTGKRLYRVAPAGYIHTLVMEKSLYWETGGHPTITMNEDHAYIPVLLKSRALLGPPVTLERPTFILRGNTGRLHVTEAFNETGHDDASWDLIRKEVDDQGISGSITIEPGWLHDYSAKAQNSWEAVCGKH